MSKVKEESVVIRPPNFATIETLIEGTAPLVVSRFWKKAELMEKMGEGKSAKNKKDHQARDYDKEADQARHWNSSYEWEGVHAGGFRAGMVSACRLVGFKMTLMKLSCFVLQDDFCADLKTPLIRIYGESVVDTSYTRNSTGVVDVRARPLYPKWACRVRVRFDADQFSATDVINLISRVGFQVGIGEGRPDSKSSVGCGWGTFRVVPSDEEQAVKAQYKIA